MKRGLAKTLSFYNRYLMLLKDSKEMINEVCNRSIHDVDYCIINEVWEEYQNVHHILLYDFEYDSWADKWNGRLLGLGSKIEPYWYMSRRLYFWSDKDNNE